MAETPNAAESLRARVARAMWDEGAWCGDCMHSDWDECSLCQEDTGRYADVALRVITEDTR